MGLSSEERYVKFLNGLRWFRGSLTVLLGTTPKTTKRIVRSWIHRVDLIAGLIIKQTDNTGLYWITGENEGSFRGLIGETHGHSPKNPDLEGPAVEVDAGSLIDNPKYGSLEWYRRINYKDFVAGMSNHHTKHEGADTLACWWDAWGYVDGILYPLFRYDDRAFPGRVQRLFLGLIGELVNQRFDICCEHQEDQERLDSVEKAMLIKRRAFDLSLDEKTKSRKGLDRYTKDFDGNAVLEEIASLQLDRCATMIKEAGQKNYEDRLRRRRNAEPEKPKVSGLFGPEPRSEEELLRVVDTSPDYKECKAASDELGSVYHTYSGWEHRFRNGKPIKPTKKGGK